MMTFLFLAAAMQPATLTNDLSEAELKHYFKMCDRIASTVMLDDADGANCSYIYEELKRRVFDGDNRALIEWWRKDKQQ